MKKTFFITALMVLIGCLSHEIYAQGGPGPEKTKVLLANVEDSTQVLAYPLDVMSIISAKCLGCHSPGSRSEKAREELQWILLQDMSTMDVVAKMDDLLEVLDEGKMPPERMVERFPNMKLTEEEVALLKDWAESTAKSAMGE